MDDMTWMSSFYEPPVMLSKLRPAVGVWATTMALVVVGCGGILLMAWSQLASSAGLAAAFALPLP